MTVLLAPERSGVGLSGSVRIGLRGLPNPARPLRIRLEDGFGGVVVAGDSSKIEPVSLQRGAGAHPPRWRPVAQLDGTWSGAILLPVGRASHPDLLRGARVSGTVATADSVVAGQLDSCLQLGAIVTCR